jgi:hypothetical protein
MSAHPAGECVAQHKLQDRVHVQQLLPDSTSLQPSMVCLCMLGIGLMHTAGICAAWGAYGSFRSSCCEMFGNATLCVAVLVLGGSQMSLTHVMHCGVLSS